ncbi:hypothetical protein ACFGVS_22390 [Mucilaginibacter sp. AW1-7]|uniref:hypothetical protein n=1 Tax=Mucilaginibacter sp. AW1-7 TaxID=3349874 RepID=UPI003F741E65
MASNYIPKEIDITIAINSNYYLHVLIGNGQAGATTFKNFEGQIYKPEVFNAVIGKGNDIKGKSTDVISNVLEINPDTDSVIITYYVTDKTLGTTDDLTDDMKAGDSAAAPGANKSLIFDTTLTFSEA